MRMAKGGSTREVEIELNAGKDDIIGIAKSIFFTDGNSYFGPEQLMTFGLANFQHEDISTIKFSGIHLAFTLQRCVEKCKMPRVRLVLCLLNFHMFIVLLCSLANLDIRKPRQ